MILFSRSSDTCLSSDIAVSSDIPCRGYTIGYLISPQIASSTKLGGNCHHLHTWQLSHRRNGYLDIRCSNDLFSRSICFLIIAPYAFGKQLFFLFTTCKYLLKYQYYYYLHISTGYTYTISRLGSFFLLFFVLDISP